MPITLSSPCSLVGHKATRDTAVCTAQIAQQNQRNRASFPLRLIIDVSCAREYHRNVFNRNGGWCNEERAKAQVFDITDDFVNVIIPCNLEYKE